MKPIDVTDLNGLDISPAALQDDEILAVIAGSLAAQGRGER